MHTSRSVVVTLCALLMSLALTLAGAPSSAQAVPSQDAPQDTQLAGTGTIRIRYSKEGAAYHAYRLFDVVLPNDDSDPDAESIPLPAGTEYEYVIAKTFSEGDKSHKNPWWTFLTTHGPDGAKSATPYAVLSDEKDEHKLDEAYFVIDVDAVGLKSGDYHQISVTKKFMNAHRIDTSKYAQTAPGQAGMGQPEADEAPVSGVVQLVRDFARAALNWAEEQPFDNETGHYVATSQPTSSVDAHEDNARADMYRYTGDDAHVENIPLGYYLLDTKTGAICSLSTNGGVSYVYDKNEKTELFVQVRAKGSVASRLSYIEQGEEEQRDLVWSEDYLKNWAYSTDANLGDYVQFKTVIIALQGVKDYELHDVMEEGLTFVDDDRSHEPTGLYDDSALVRDGTYDYSPRVYLYHQATGTTYDIPQRVGKRVNWEIHADKDSKHADGCDFEVKFYDADADERDEDKKATFAHEVAGEDGKAATETVGIDDWDRIVVTYWARLNDGAISYGSDIRGEELIDAKDLSKVREGTGGKGKRLKVQAHTATDGNERNTNSAVLTYGGDDHTTWARAEVTTYQFDVVRVEAKDDDASAGGAEQPVSLLGGAELHLCRCTTEPTVGLESYDVSVSGNEHTYYYDPGDVLRFASRGGSSCIVTHGGTGETTLRTKASGPLNVRGLEAGLYLLFEDAAPEGCDPLGQPVVVAVHGEAYTNTDIMEDNNPGFRHSNEEGDVTVTNTLDGVMQEDVRSWEAVTKGSPATYARRYTKKGTDQATENGGVVLE